MKEINYSELKEAEHQGYSQVGDFFQFLTVKKALTPLWNEYCEIDYEQKGTHTHQSLEDYRKFSIENPEHLSFLREIFANDVNLCVFFQNLRENAIESGAIKNIAENYMTITQMILCMQNLADLVDGPYPMASFFNERVRDIIEENTFTTAQMYDDETDSVNTVHILGNFEKIINLTGSGFSPITQYGDLVQSESIALCYHIVKDAVIPGNDYPGELIPVCIDKTGKVYEGIERLQAFITQYRYIIENIQHIRLAQRVGKADKEYMRGVVFTFDIRGVLKYEDKPNFADKVLEKLSEIEKDAILKLTGFCEELGSTMKLLGENTDEYNPLKSKLYEETKKNFPTVGPRIKRVK